MQDSYNDDKELEDQKRASRFRQFKYMSQVFAVKGKPSQYKVNLISLGRVGYSFAKQLLDYMKFDPSFIGLHVWHRIKRGIEDGTVVDVQPSESKAPWHRDLLDIMTGEQEKLQFTEYRCLRDLEAITQEKNNNPSIGSITVVAGRYDFSFRYPDSSGNDRLLYSSHADDIPLIESILQTSVYDVDSSAEKKMEELLAQRKAIVKIVDNVMNKKGLAECRAINLIDSILGIRELAKAFEGYTGNTLIATNEVDTTAYVFAKQSHTDPRKTTGLSLNDQLRYHKFLADELRRFFSEADDLYVPLVGSHNEFITPIWELITIRDIPLTDYQASGLDPVELLRKVAQFGESVYRSRSSSDEDSALGLLQMVKSIMYEDFRGFQTIRASTNYKDA